MTGGTAAEPRPHELTRAQFDALAGGLGDAATLETLGRTQVSKRLLLLREVRWHTELGAAAAWSTLDAAIAADAAAVRALLSRPFVDVWACRVLRGEGRPEAHGGYLTGLAAAAGVVAGTPFELARPSGPDPVLLPGVGRIGAAAGPAGGAAAGGGGVLSFDGSTLRLGRYRVPVRSEPAPSGDGPWTGYRRVRWPVDGEIERIELDDLDPHRSCFGLPPADRLDEAAAGRLTVLVGEALALIDRQLAPYVPTVRRCLRALVPAAPPREGSVSASNQSAFGAVAVSPTRDAGELALLLVHETQHAKLGALLDLVDLVDPADRTLHHAPWRIDPRPAGALLQGTYAHAAVADFWRLRRPHLSGHAVPVAEFEYAYWRAQAGRAADTLVRSSALTSLGRSFVARLAESMSSWPDDVAPRIRRAVADCTVAADVEWRLRNYRIPAARLAELTTAYRSGRPCPPVPPPQVQPDGARGAAMTGSLVRELRQRAISVHPAEDGAARATAPLRPADPADPQAWARFALGLVDVDPHAARALIERPDLVCVVSGGVAGAEPTTPDAGAGHGPAEVATWLSGGLPPAAGPAGG